MSKQQDLFDTAPAPWILDDEDDWLAARIVFSEAPYGPYDYLVQDSLRDQIKIGQRVKVPIGRGKRTLAGYCIDLFDHRDREKLTVALTKMKSVAEIIDKVPLIDSKMLRLAKWISEYYICPLGSCLETVVPAGVRGQRGTRLVTYLKVPNKVLAQLTSLKLPAKQLQVLQVIAASTKPVTAKSVCAAVGCTTAPITGLKKKGLLEVFQKREQQHIEEPPVEKLTQFHELNDDQANALQAIVDVIDSQKHQTLVLRGITGSGKTEVYIRAIEHAISFGRQAIVLVPEISLTPQTRQRFRERFDRVAVMHSHLTDSERNWHWQRIANGEIQVVVGARSAVFAPTPNLGMIVIDEEHDASFKQDKAPRYHARSVALQRARIEEVPLVLGSATPSLETYNAAQANNFQLLHMANRVSSLPLPDVTAIDLRTEFKSRESRGAISRRLHMAMYDALSDGGQVILLLNRRGFATSIQCPSCGYVLECSACDMPLTHHLDTGKAICHYCDFETFAPNRCNSCDFEGIKLAGLGTQKLEEEVKRRFPDHKCLRMDSDSMSKSGSHEEALSRFREGEIDILLGTQMIAKGLDFPNVTLVGVINADTALHFPDFRAAERTFGLVTQVAGRTGRSSKGGRVFVQTYSPDHPAILASLTHDYESFAEQELKNRVDFGYPPYAKLARIVLRSENKTHVESFADHMTHSFDKFAAESKLETRILGPAPCPIAKLRGYFRFHILIQYKRGSNIHPVLTQLSEVVQTPDSVQWIIDVDPIDLL